MLIFWSLIFTILKLVEMYLQDEDNLLSLTEARIILSIFLPVRVQQEQVTQATSSTQELVETILYSMDSQKDGYVRHSDLVAGIRSSNSFSLSL